MLLVLGANLAKGPGGGASIINIIITIVLKFVNFIFLLLIFIIKLTKYFLD